MFRFISNKTYENIINAYHDIRNKQMVLSMENNNFRSKLQALELKLKDAVEREQRTAQALTALKRDLMLAGTFMKTDSNNH